jgi:hypothetical protein
MTMNVDATLRRLDEEIVGHRQQIATHQVAIARLEDTRKVLMGLAEGDQIAREVAKAERVGQISGEHARPMLIVRRTGTGDEDGTESARRKGPPVKNGKPRDYERERELAKARLEGKQPEPKKEPKHYTSATKYGGGKELMQKIVSLVQKTGPIASREIGNRLDMPTSSNERQPLSNALWQLKKEGVLKRDDNKLYSVVRSGMQ